MSLRDKVKSYDKKYGTGNFWRPEEGKNQFRVLTEPELYDDVYEGEPAGSFISYIMVRYGGDDSFALFTLPKSLVRWLADQEDLGKFNSYPMPFDVMLFKQTTGKKTTYVSVAVELSDSPVLTAQQQAIVAAAKPITEVADALAKKKSKDITVTALSAATPAAVVEQVKLKSRAEVNNMFIAISNAINNSKNVEDVGKALGMVAVSREAGSLNSFEADTLDEIGRNKESQLTGVVAEAINVDGIPF